MKEFISWLFNSEHIFTFVTVILSGLISWIISAAYYRKTNRNALRQNVILPIKRKLKESRSWNNYKNLEALSKTFETRYLTKKEQQLLSNLLTEYKSVCDYNRSYVYAESLFSYFCKTLTNNNIDIKVVPIYFNDELIYFNEPNDLECLREDIKRIVDRNPPECVPDPEDAEPIEEIIKPLFKSYCKRFFVDKEIDYFCGTTVYEIYKKSTIKQKWDEKLEKYKLIEKDFLETKICQ